MLRDTGCSGIVIRNCTVADGSFIVGKEQVCVLADGSKVTVPVAEVYIDSPYLKGRYEAQCMGNPVYDLIVGNVPGAKSPDEMDQKWQANAVETRQQKINKGKPYFALKVP